MTDLLFLRPASGVARFSFSARWRAVYGLAAAVSRRILYRLGDPALAIGCRNARRRYYN